MANIIIRDEQRSADERRVAETFGANMASAEQREHVEYISAKSREAMAAMHRMEER